MPTKPERIARWHALFWANHPAALDRCRGFIRKRRDLVDDYRAVALLALCEAAREHVRSGGRADDPAFADTAATAVLRALRGYERIERRSASRELSASRNWAQPWAAGLDGDDPGTPPRALRPRAPRIHIGTTPGQRRRTRRNLAITLCKTFGLSDRYLSDAFDLPRSCIQQIVAGVRELATASNNLDVAPTETVS